MIMENLVFIWQGYLPKLNEEIAAAITAGCRVVIYSHTYENGTVFSDTEGKSLTAYMGLEKALEAQKKQMRLFLKKACGIRMVS